MGAVLYCTAIEIKILQVDITTAFVQQSIWAWLEGIYLLRSFKKMFPVIRINGLAIIAQMCSTILFIIFFLR